MFHFRTQENIMDNKTIQIIAQMDQELATWDELFSSTPLEENRKILMLLVETANNIQKDLNPLLSSVGKAALIELNRQIIRYEERKNEEV